jgi:transcription-repair coupling factor (superfamily II helicase)
MLNRVQQHRNLKNKILQIIIKLLGGIASAIISAAMSNATIAQTFAKSLQQQKLGDFISCKVCLEPIF